MSFVERFFIRCPYFGGSTIGGSTVFTVTIILICTHQYYLTEMSVGRVRQSMVNNPVYEGPLYESVEVKFATLLAEDAQQLEATSDTKIPTQKIAHYVDYFSEPVPIKCNLI